MKDENKNPVNPVERNDVNPATRDKSPKPDTTADRGLTDIEKISKSHTIPNSGGQSANQTDNRQSTVNRGNQDSNKRGR